MNIVSSRSNVVHVSDNHSALTITKVFLLLALPALSLAALSRGLAAWFFGWSFDWPMTTGPIFARTDTKGFHKHVFSAARAIYFLKGRVKFHREDGSCPKNGPAAPSCLVAHTDEDTAAILNSGLTGSLMRPS